MPGSRFALRHVISVCGLFMALLLHTPAGSQDLEPMLLVPAIAGSLYRDSDGDGLPDVWERQGYTENGVFVDLPTMGADPQHKDLFVWMDYMVRPDSVSLAPSQTVIDRIKAVFANAPVQNPDGTTGINIHPVLGSQVTYVETLGEAGDYTKVWLQFDSLKNDFFNPAYAKAFRYMIWANSYNQGTSSGLARDIPAVNFLVTLGEWGAPGGTDWEKQGTFIHELGHCLGLTHGGTDHDNYKPNYLSIMSYFFQTSGLYIDGHWGDAGYPLHFDYQRMNTPSLDENHLNESLGMTGAADLSHYGSLYYYFDSTWKEAFAANAAGQIDWNKNGVIEADVAADINASGGRSVLSAQNNWPNINYDADGQIGPNSAAAVTKARRKAIPDELRHELDNETNERLKRLRQELTPPPSGADSLPAGDATTR
ncbi:hypothetical protein [Desulfolutivibrio sulfodismutans]|uniref:hypothetical protein n=1 Tax=Desulfolutivibrio sulfodismutans TaxID=63561 RepID=UPI00159DB9A9|nr:hypothetical protein [Desulfolutivibrio sulfodismutans]